MFTKKNDAFSYIDAIYGLTIILGIVAALYGSINSVMNNFRKAQLVSHADKLSQYVLQEIQLRKYDENINDFPDTPLTNFSDFGTDDGEIDGNINDFDDIDDFNNFELRDNQFEGLTAVVSVNYASFDLATNSIALSAVPTTLKRIEVSVSHSDFDNLFKSSRVFGSGISPEEFLIPPYATQILADKSPGLNVLTAPSSIAFEVIFNEEVYIDNTDPDFSLYIDFEGFILRGEPGSHTVSASDPGELRAYYSPGDIDPTLTGQDTLKFNITLPDTTTSRSLNDFLSYRPLLVLNNGSIENIDQTEALLDLPLPESENSFLSTTQILPILPAMDLKIYTEDDLNRFNTTIRDTIREDMAQIIASWPRADKNIYYPDPGAIPSTSPALEFALAADGRTINSTVNHHPGPIALISPDSLTEYTFEAVLNSTRTDDDGIGFIIAFQQSKELQCNLGFVNGASHEDFTECSTSSDGENNYFLAAWRTGRGTRATQRGDSQFAVTFGEGNNYLNHNNPIIFRNSNKNAEYFIHDRKQISGDDKTNWGQNKWTKIKVERTGEYGENINVYATRFYQSKLEAQNGEFDINNAINVDLTADPRYHKFLGPSRYGYTVWSQNNATWHDPRLVKNTIIRKDVAILISSEGDNREVQQYQQADAAGVFRALNVNLIRLNLGYTRKIFNSDPLASREFLLLENSIIEYPWNDD